MVGTLCPQLTACLGFSLSLSLSAPRPLAFSLSLPVVAYRAIDLRSGFDVLPGRTHLAVRAETSDRALGTPSAVLWPDRILTAL